MQTISLCLTNYNRFELLIESFRQVINDDRISEIVISDDNSDPEIYNQLKALFAEIPKVEFYRNEKNVGMSLNKKLAIERAQNKRCIIFDSDNVITTAFIDALYALPIWDSNIIYAPEFAKPEFDYRAFTGKAIHKNNVKDFLSQPMFDCLLNTCNYFVDREKYLEVYEHNPAMKATDTVYFNYLWLKKGYSFYVVPGLQYDHRVHAESGFLEDVDYNLAQASKVRQLIKECV